MFLQQSPPQLPQYPQSQPMQPEPGYDPTYDVGGQQVTPPQYSPEPPRHPMIPAYQGLHHQQPFLFHQHPADILAGLVQNLLGSHTNIRQQLLLEQAMRRLAPLPFPNMPTPAMQARSGFIGSVNPGGPAQGFGPVN